MGLSLPSSLLLDTRPPTFPTKRHHPQQTPPPQILPSTSHSQQLLASLRACKNKKLTPVSIDPAKTPAQLQQPGSSTALPDSNKSIVKIQNPLITSAVDRLAELRRRRGLLFGLAMKIRDGDADFVLVFDLRYSCVVSLMFGYLIRCARRQGVWFEGLAI